MRHHHIDFEEHRIPLFTPSASDEIASFGCGSTVPILLDGGIKIWDSLAILEYLAEKHNDCSGWPADAARRAHARSVSAEMHSGFTAVRSELPMNCRRVISGFNVPVNVEKEIARINTIFTACRQAYASDGDWLFGQYSIADAMYTPVVMRFNTYGITLDSDANNYMQTVKKQLAVAEWIKQSHAETEVIESAEK